MGKSKFKIKVSDIHGKGLFAITRIASGDVLFAIKKAKSWPAGFEVLNHSALSANALLLHRRNELLVVALCDIPPGTEVTCNYGRHSISWDEWFPGPWFK